MKSILENRLVMFFVTIATTFLIVSAYPKQEITTSVVESPKPNPIISTMIEMESSEPVKYKKTEQLSPKKLKAILYSVGFRGERLKEAWATAMKESTGRPMSHNKNSSTGDNSYGLFQINMIGSLGPARREQFDLESNKDLLDPIRNAEIAFFMSNGGKDWSSWNGITENTIQWMSKYPG